MSESVDIDSAEWIERDDWNNLNEPCPECDNNQFECVEYSTTIYHDGKSVNDRWDKAGTLRIKCQFCQTILHRHPAYDILEDIHGQN